VKLQIETDRYHYLDNLRALAMLAGVLFHAALAYSPLMHKFWLTADRSRSEWVDVAVWFLHLFRMPLFFAIAGFFASRLVSRRGVGGMMRNRMARVLLPLAVFWPVVTASIGWLTNWAAGWVQNPSPLLGMLRRSELPTVPPGLAHLWFLGYLMWFYLWIWIAATAEWRVPPGWAEGWTPGKLLGVAPLLLAPALALVSAPTPAPDGLLPQLWALGYYGMFFFFGYGLDKQPSLLNQLRRWSMSLAAASLAGYAAFLYLLKEHGTNPVAHVLEAVLQAYLSVWLTLWLLQAGHCWMNAHSRWLRYLSDGSYWTYLVHLPVVFAVQYLLLDWEANWFIKWTVSVLSTITLCLASYQFGVRGRLLDRVLNGRIGAREGRGATSPKVEFSL